MIALGYLAEAAFGSGTVVNGLACVPTTPTADLNVHVGRGMIASLSTIDATAYGSLAADTTDSLLKMGINIATTNFAITPPATAGYSQNYLIEGQLLESDTTAVVLPYYNASNPATPYSGPANSGTAQNTLRIQRVSLQLKAGTAYATGSAQNTPGADSGWTPLWIIGVNNGQTQITSANIAMAAGAPFLLNQLGNQFVKCTGNLTLYVSANGSDSNNGLLPSSAFLTIQAAYNALVNGYNLNGYNASISIGAGTFAPVVCQSKPAGLVGEVLLTGVSAASTSIVSTSGNVAVHAQNGAAIAISGMTISGGYGLVTDTGGYAQILSGVTFGACAQSQILATNSQISIINGYTISGGSTAHWNANVGGVITNNSTSPITITLTGTPAFSVAFAEVAGGNVTTYSPSGNVTFSGSATGLRFSVLLGGAIDTNGAGSGSGVSNTFLPGNLNSNAGSGINIGFYA